MTWVLRRTDQGGGWVADMKRSSASYTKRLQQAKRYPTREAAEQDRCPGNEVAERYEEAV
jgi:hypothetical protein